MLAAARLVRTPGARRLLGRTQMNHRMTVTAVVLASACSRSARAPRSRRTSTSTTSGKDFSGYKTYKWVEIQGAEKPDAIVDTQIKQAIDKRWRARA